MSTLKRTIARSALRDEAKALIEINFELNRKSSFYIYVFIIPCIIISVLMPLTLLLPNDSGGKVPASVMTMLVLVVLLITLVRTVPPSESAPLLGEIFCFLMTTSYYQSRTYSKDILGVGWTLFLCTTPRMCNCGTLHWAN